MGSEREQPESDADKTWLQRNESKARIALVAGFWVLAGLSYALYPQRVLDLIDRAPFLVLLGAFLLIAARQSRSDDFLTFLFGLKSLKAGKDGLTAEWRDTARDVMKAERTPHAPAAQADVGGAVLEANQANAERAAAFVSPEPDRARKVEGVLQTLAEVMKRPELRGGGVSEDEINRVMRRSAANADVLKDRRILWIDDHPSNNVFETKAFTRMGMTVTAAVDDAAARTALRGGAGPYDLIISDIERHGDPAAGLAFLAELRRTSDIPLIFYVTDLKPELGVPPGAFGITEHVDELIHLILDVLERKRRRA